MSLTIDPSLKALIPPLSTEERDLLEASILEHGCRDPLVVWRGTLLDGHNRFEICQRHGLPYETVRLEFESVEQARIWIRNNQMGRRNLSTAWRIDLQLANKEDLEEIGKRKMSQGGGDKKSDFAKSGLSQIDKPDREPKHDTRKEIAKAANTSTGMVGMAEVVRKKAPELWEKAKRDEVTVSAAYKTIKKKEDIQKRAEAVKAQTAEQSKALPSSIHLADAFDWLQEAGPFDLLLTDPPL